MCPFFAILRLRRILTGALIYELIDCLFVCFISVVNGMAEGDIFPDAEVQKAALQIVINCVCRPVTRVSYRISIHDQDYQDIPNPNPTDVGDVVFEILA